MGNGKNRCFAADILVNTIVTSSNFLIADVLKGTDTLRKSTADNKYILSWIVPTGLLIVVRFLEN